MLIKENLQKIESTIDELCRELELSSPEILLVSKGQSLEKIRQLLDDGRLNFAENYLQELQKKSEELSDTEIRWHFIGQLQSRKIKNLVQICHSIHSVSSEKHARLIDQAALSLGKTNFPIFISVNIENEPGKSGVPTSELDNLTRFITNNCPSVRLMGIMAIPPRSYSDATHSTVPEAYTMLRSLADRVGERKLSLGMSGDFKLAIKAGTDFIRLGTCIFGERKYNE